MNLPDIHLDADICHIAPRLAVGFLFREAVANHLGSTESFKSRYPVRLGRLTGDAAKHHLDDEGRVEAESGCDSWRIRPPISNGGKSEAKRPTELFFGPTK